VVELGLEVFVLVGLVVRHLQLVGGGLKREAFLLVLPFGPVLNVRERRMVHWAGSLALRPYALLCCNSPRVFRLAAHWLFQSVCIGRVEFKCTVQSVFVVYIRRLVLIFDNHISPLDELFVNRNSGDGVVLFEGGRLFDPGARAESSRVSVLLLSEI